MTWQGKSRYLHVMVVQGQPVEFLRCGVVPVGIEDYPGAWIDLPFLGIPSMYQKRVRDGDQVLFEWDVTKGHDRIRWSP